MLFGGIESGGLEIRRKGGQTRISGSFPYNSLAVLSDGGKRGRPRKEKFAPGAFEYSIDISKMDIHLLLGHSFDKPLASKLGGSLVLKDTRSALLFEAILSPEVAETSHAKDALALLSAGLIAGISPGFRVAPDRVAPNAEEVTEEPPAEGNALIRTINQAVLYELSLVTRPAYPDTTVEQRNWDVTQTITQTITRNNSRYRWRA